jgi:hypothetical protein
MCNESKEKKIVLLKLKVFSLVKTTNVNFFSILFELVRNE